MTKISRVQLDVPPNVLEAKIFEYLGDDSAGYRVSIQARNGCAHVIKVSDSFCHRLGEVWVSGSQSEGHEGLLKVLIGDGCWHWPTLVAFFAK